jgi:hypothetical protein
VFRLSSEQSSNDFTTSVVKAATAACQEEIQTLILKQSELHFDGSHTGLSQLEGFSITEDPTTCAASMAFGWMSARCGARSSLYHAC